MAGLHRLRFREIEDHMQLGTAILGRRGGIISVGYLAVYELPTSAG
jgi:hypothetical protein